MTPPLNRRDFLAQATATAALAATASAAAPPPWPRTVRAKNALPKSPTDKVTLGKTGIQVSLVGMGTGSVGSGQASNQTRLGVKGFTRVVRHALDRGVCFFDVADQYGSHTYLREALKGVPRDQYVIQTKTHATNVADARSHLERYRMELGVDYIDIVLLHCMTKEGWPAENQGLDGIPDAGQGGEAHPRPRHKLPRHGPAAHLGQEPVRRGRPRPDQSRRADHGRPQARRGRLASSRRCTTPARASWA